MAQTQAETGQQAGKKAGRVEHRSVAERVEIGKAARKQAPRAVHAEFEPSPGRPDPIALLEGQAETRVPELVPIRYGRMLVSPFAFYRGCGADHGRRPRPNARLGDPRTALRRRPPVELRRLRLGRAQPGLRPERLRRDAARPLGVGCQAAGRQPGGRRPRERLHAQGAKGDRARDDGRLPDRDAAVRGDAQPGGLVRPPGHRAAARCAPRSVPAEVRQADGANPGQGAHQGQHERVLQADPRGRRRAADHQRPAADRARPRARPRRPRRRDHRGRDGVHPRLPAHAAERPPDPAGTVPVCRHGAQGGRRRQRRHTSLDRPPDGAGRGGSAIHAGEGGAALGARGVRRQEPPRQRR